MFDIAVSSPSFSSSNFLKNKLLEKFPEKKIKFLQEKSELKEPFLSEFLKETETVIVGKEKITLDLLNKLPNLKAIAKYGVGVDNIDFLACKKHNIKVYHTPGVNADAVAEHTLGLIISLMRNISYTDRKLHSENLWIKNGGSQLHGKTVGIVGVGHVGSRLAEILKSFRCKLLFNDILDKHILCQKFDATQVSLSELFECSDIISLHVPLTTETEHFIEKNLISSMKKDSYLINCSRGQIIKQDHLIWALKNNMIAGAALDVYEEEPLQNSELTSLDNVVLTPHIAGNALEAVNDMGLAAINGLTEYFI